MNPEDHKRVLLDLAHQFDSGKELTDSQRQYLAIVFYRIATGEDANKVLGVKGTKGKKLVDVIARRRMSMILHWVACVMYPDPSTGEKAMTLSDACVAAMDAIVPVAKATFPGAEKHHYDAEYIARCWTDSEYAHMRSPERGWFDPDFPYYALPAVKDPK